MTERTIQTGLATAGCVLAVAALVAGLRPASTAPESGPSAAEPEPHQLVFELALPGSQLGESLVYRLYDDEDLVLRFTNRRGAHREHRVALAAEEYSWFLEVIASGRFADFDPAGPEARKLASVSRARVDGDDWHLTLGEFFGAAEEQPFRCPLELERRAYNDDLRRIPQVAAVWALAAELERRWREVEPLRRP